MPAKGAIMEREQAAEIQDYLLDAAFAVDEARAAIDLLSEGEREKLAAPLGQVMSALHAELWRAIHGRFPDLIPFREFPAISSALRWDQVRLPPGISEADIDAIILS